MFTSIPSLDSVLQCLLPVFTQPSFQTHIEVLLGWVMCLSKRTEYGVFQTIQADTPLSRKERHPFDRFYNFFSRSAWTVRDLAHQVAMAIVVRLNPRGLLYLVVDDTLLHKRGKHVYGLGWFRDAVASTAKRVATASGNHWVVVGLAISIPKTNKSTACRSTPDCTLRARTTPARLRWPRKCSRTCCDGSPIESWFSSAMGPIRRTTCWGISTRGYPDAVLSLLKFINEAIKRQPDNRDLRECRELILQSEGRQEEK